MNIVQLKPLSITADSTLWSGSEVVSTVKYDRGTPIETIGQYVAATGICTPQLYSVVSDNIHVGCIQLRDSEVCYWLMPEYRGRGIMSLALSILQDERNCLLTARVEHEDRASRRILKRAHFVEINRDDTWRYLEWRPQTLADISTTRMLNMLSDRYRMYYSRAQLDYLTEEQIPLCVFGKVVASVREVYAELDKRGHVPNKGESKVIRQLRAQTKLTSSDIRKHPAYGIAVANAQRPRRRINRSEIEWYKLRYGKSFGRYFYIKD